MRHCLTTLCLLLGLAAGAANAADDIKKQATHVTDNNECEGFARAMETVLKLA